ncbi:MAG: CopD family protein [Gammaproteobacteria bacterium]|nr:CopD family protein [Gammaproteobacteria bacterium]
MPVAIVLHLLAAVVWVGGMFFAYVVLRPVAATFLEPPQRLPLWAQAFARFFVWVWAAVVLLPVTGYAMLFMHYGGMFAAPLFINIMQALAWVMIAVYLFVYFIPYPQLRKTVAARDFPAAAKALAQIRKLIAFNLGVGVVTICVAAGGRFL